ncbi:alpha/beta fold hydrolase [Solimonas terrae]|uniref:Alpha/beta hydrolase n=1 Tax=Solimonas terrae TaxID=1396819 RepID=A0A6M2BU36_9GAMM|nr:alpha/beta fold hydrolase [Solimonas terrae]NGY05457.1 alpha/beta hydrolase [Solimonas terrae]
MNPETQAAGRERCRHPPRARLIGMLLAGGLPLFAGCFSPPYPSGQLGQLFPDPPQPELKVEQLAGHTLRYAELDRAGAPRIVFLHGSPGEWQAFAGYMKRPELQVYGPLLAPDRPGFGGSEPHVVVASLDEQARRLAPLLRGAGAPAIVVGHSMGGPIAAKLAMDYPQLVRGLLLLAPSVAPEYEGQRWYQWLATWRVVQWLLPQALVDSNRELTPLQQQLREMEPGWARLRMPVYVVQGEDDGLVDPRTADFLERELVNTPHRIWRYPKAGHMLLWEHPEVVVQALQALITATQNVDANDRQ